jgi:hypothetical protein
VNDIRNLMDNLHTHVEYKEFETALRAPGDSWSVLQRITQAADGERRAAEPSIFEPGVASTPAPSPAPAAAPAPGQRSLLRRYAAANADGGATGDAEAARRLPLAEVFARLERPDL